MEGAVCIGEDGGQVAGIDPCVGVAWPNVQQIYATRPASH